MLGKFGGHQFAYEKLGGSPQGKDSFGKRISMGHTLEATYHFFYTSNISLSRALLLKEGFDPVFKGYGWEDIELGHRLTTKHNLSILYNPYAVGWHKHIITEESLAGRMRSIAQSSYHKPSVTKKIIFRVISCTFVLQMLEFLSRMNGNAKNYYYYALSKKYYLEGL